jgi:hypothetical protein
MSSSVTKDSGQPVDPNFKRQDVQKEMSTLTYDKTTDMLS